MHANFQTDSVFFYIEEDTNKRNLVEEYLVGSPLSVIKSTTLIAKDFGRGDITMFGSSKEATDLLNVMGIKTSSYN